MNIQGWFSLGLTDLISLLFKGLLRVFSNTTVQKTQFFSTQLYLWFNSHIHTWLWKNHTIDYMDICQQSDVSAFRVLSSFVIAFLSRSKCLLISWLQPLSTVISKPKKIKSFIVIFISEVIDISPGNFDYSLSFVYPGISHDVLCI